MGKTVCLKASSEPVAPYTIARPETVRHTAEVGGFLRAWEVYIPEGYDGEKEMPLVIYVHGAGGFHPEKVPWPLIAEREGFLVAYPEAVEPWLWNIWNLKTEKGAPDDVEFLDFMITRLQKDYRIDPTRIYMQGNSMGDNMVSFYAFHHGDRLVAIAPTSGPTLPSVQCDQEGNYLMQPEVPLCVARLHGDHDTKCGLPSTYGFSKAEFESQVTPKEQRQLRSIMDQMQKDLWNQVNGANGTPELYFDDYMNLEIYRGSKGVLYYYSVIDGEHSPDLDIYDIIWNQCFSGWRRIGGKLVFTGAKEDVSQDREALALAAEAHKLYLGGRILDISPALRARERDSMVYVPVKLLPMLFTGMTLEACDDEGTASLSYKGRRINVARGQQCMLVDGRVVSITPAVMEEETLLVPIVRFAQAAGGYYVDQRDSSVYMTTHPVKLTGDGADMIQILLGTKPKPYGNVAFENELKERILKARNN